MPKREKFQMRLSEEEEDAFRREAERVGTSMSEWLRQLGRRACGMPVVGEDKGGTDK